MTDMKLKARYLYNIDLQLFAEGDKSEKATPKKREEARKKGQVLQSRELVTALTLVFLLIGLQITGSNIYAVISSFIKRALTGYALSENTFSNSGLSILYADFLAVFLRCVGPLFAIALIAGLIVSYAQVGFLFTIEPLGFKFNRINPASGIKRIFSLKGIVELLKSIFKIIIVGYIVYMYLKGEAGNILNIMGMDILSIALYIGSTALNVAIRICMAFIVLGLLDYSYQWWQYEKDLMMTKQELKEEYKQVEGNPQIKSKIREKQKQMSMRRMIQDVPKADVVITNPTHFAVALKYDRQAVQAPVVLAKGQDYMAQRIKEIAKENKVEIVENKALARTIYDTVDVGKVIPAELYQAVAEVLAFVYSLGEKGKTG